MKEKRLSDDIQGFFLRYENIYQLSLLVVVSHNQESI